VAHGVLEAYASNSLGLSQISDLEKNVIGSLIASGNDIMISLDRT
jgi:hypothetical protein